MSGLAPPIAMDSEQFKRVEELFHAALALPAEQRQRFLEGACGSDTQLVETIGRLLAHVEPAADMPADPNL